MDNKIEPIAMTIPTFILLRQRLSDFILLGLVLIVFPVLIFRSFIDDDPGQRQRVVLVRDPIVQRSSFPTGAMGFRGIISKK